jgi:hypothetical protein
LRAAHGVDEGLQVEQALSLQALEKEPGEPGVGVDV